ncbi:hypothetical protein Tco_0530765 [Tanacetum coccineum]
MRSRSLDFGKGVIQSANGQKTYVIGDQPRKISQNPRNNSTNWNTPMSKKLGVGFQFTPKACFVCGSFNHLIKDCDFHDKKMVQKPVLNNVKKGTSQREVRPVWNNAMRTNHQNFSNSRRNFAPTAVLTKSGLVPISTARQSSSRAATSVSTVRPIKTAAPKSFVNVAKTRPNAFQKLHSPSRRPFYQQTALKNRNLNNKVNTVKVNSVNIAKGKRVTSAVGEQGINVVKSKACWVWRLKIKVGDKAVHKELGDRMETAVTTASSFEAEQDNDAQTRFDAAAKTTASTNVNGEVELIASIDGQAKTIMKHPEEVILKLEDNGGISSLPNTEIFEQLDLMGYATDSDKLTFQKGNFSPQWRFFIHTILHCLSPKKTSWEQFSSNIATAIICLATNRTFNFSKFIFDAMQMRLLQPHTRTYPTPVLTQKVFSNMKRVTRGYSGKDIPLFPSMITAPETSPSRITSSPSLSPHHTPVSAPSTSPPPITETTPTAEEPAPMPHESPLQSVQSLGRDEGKDEVVEEDSSKQGRSLIEELDMDADISLVLPHDAEIQEKISDDTEVLLEEEKTTELIKEPTYLVEDQVVSTAAEGLVYIRMSAKKKKDKGKAIMIEDESVQKKSKKQMQEERLGNEEATRLQEQIDEGERKRIARDAEIAKQLKICLRILTGMI